MRAAHVVIDAEKAAFYHGLWRKWFLLWTTTSRWITATGEGRGSIDGQVGMAALAAFDVDMGDSS